MNVTADNDIKRMNNDSYCFWANYSSPKRIRCLIGRDTIDDYFYNDANNEAEVVKTLQKNWNTIWPLFQDKIKNGKIETIEHNNGPTYIANRYQKIYQVQLKPEDFNFKDFRQAA